MVELIEYYGTECTHCAQMKEMVERLEKEMGVNVVKKEIYHNSENQKAFMEDAKGKCRGIPFLINKKTGKYICIRATYDELKEWAQA